MKEGTYKRESDDACYCILYSAVITFRSITFRKMPSKYWILSIWLIIGLCVIGESEASPVLASIFKAPRHHNGKITYHIISKFIFNYF